MERIWLKSYPDGVPADIEASRYPSLVDLLEESFNRYHDRVAYTCMGASLTFGDIDRLSRALAAYLQECNLARGRRVALMMPNVLQYPVALLRFFAPAISSSTSIRSIRRANSNIS